MKLRTPQVARDERNRVSPRVGARAAAPAIALLPARLRREGERHPAVEGVPAPRRGGQALSPLARQEELLQLGEDEAEDESRSTQCKANLKPF